MPAIHVRSSRHGPDVEHLLREVARVSARVLGEEPAGTWTTHVQLDRQAIGEQVDPAHPIAYVDVWVRSRGPEVDRALLREVCGAVAVGVGVPVEDVWGTLRLVEDGMVFAGGDVIG